MSEQIPVRTKSGDLVYIEVYDSAQTGRATSSAESIAFTDTSLLPRGREQGAADRVLQEAIFSKAVAVIRGLVEDVGHGLMTADPKPSQVELELGMGLGASGNIVIFKGDANATFKLKLTWKS